MLDLEKLLSKPSHVVAICGGAVSGSEAAALCAERGLVAVVFEQNSRPYGKIEDGLPRWHDKLRQKEYVRIDANLARERVLFVPSTLIGRDVSVDELRQHPGVSALLLANGAWRDRALTLPGLAVPGAVEDASFVYQNAFVHWFNHYEEPGYSGPTFEVEHDTIVIGGGLASIDVAKIVNLELYRRALRARGLTIAPVEFEHQGIPKLLAAHGLRVEDLGVRPATIYYRRRRRDMPIATPHDQSLEQLRKTENVREKMVQILAQKYLVRVEECHVPTAIVREGGRLRGVRFRRNQLQDGKLVELIDSEYEVPASLVISSIGSVPEALPGVPQRGELYDYADWTTGELRGLAGVFGLGNVLTGQGNIKDSRESARDVAQRAIDGYLGIIDVPAEQLAGALHELGRAAIARTIEAVSARPPGSPELQRAFLLRVLERWRALGYSGDYRTWLAAHPAA
jgi:ferredoxin--NADP+ reductase